MIHFNSEDGKALLTDFGIGFSNITPLNDLLSYADLAEKYALNFWLNEGYHNRSAIVIMTAIATRTRKIKLGLGIVSPILRHPYLIAMEAATIDELSNGRLRLGLGLAASGAAKHNIDVSKIEPIERMSEAAGIIRKLIAGESVLSTKFYEAGPGGAKLSFKPLRSSIPLYLGAMHSGMLRLAGENFDGAILNYACPIPYVEYAMRYIREGVKERKVKTKLSVSAMVLLSVAESRSDAFEASRRYLPHYLSRMYPITAKYAGVTEKEISPVLEALKSSRHDEAIAEVPDSVIRKLTISGTPSDCITELLKYSEAGVNEIIAEQILGPKPNEALGLIANEIVAKLVRSS
ncbi:MAG: LLM class flavin-dependent oxidoreductase [Nitrososphaerales archaeon]